MNAAATQFDTAGWTIAQWQAAYLAGARPRRCWPAMPPRRTRPPTMPGSCGSTVGAGAPAGRTGAAAGGGGRGPVAPAAVWRALRGQGQHRRRGLADHRCLPRVRHTPDEDAGVVRRLRAAGAILIGKTNLDQFATGLVGTRSPHGAVANAFRPEYISGGSSSGSASVVARGLAVFSLAPTRPARDVPAGFNNIVGLKPTRGWLSAAGVVPACRTLDCVSVFAPDGRRRLARGRHRRRLRRARSLLRRAGRHGPSLAGAAAFRGAGQAGVPRRRRGRGRLRRGAA